MPKATDAESDLFIYKVFNWPANATFTANPLHNRTYYFRFEQLTPAAAGNYPDMVYAAEERNVPLNV